MYVKRIAHETQNSVSGNIFNLNKLNKFENIEH